HLGPVLPGSVAAGLPRQSRRVQTARRGVCGVEATMTRVLITGGAGFIGSHVADRLLARGDHVLVIDNYATGRRDNLRPSLGLQVVEGSIADGAVVDRLFDDFKPECVIHAAASYKDPHAWPEDARTNVAGTTNVVQASERAKVRRL